MLDIAQTDCCCLGAGLYYKAMARANIALVLLLALALVAASSIDAARVVPAGSPSALHIGPVVLDDPGCRPTL